MAEGLFEIIRLAENWRPPSQPDMPPLELIHLRRIVATALPRLKTPITRSGTRGQRASEQSVLLVSPDTIGPVMAGPAIRYWEMAQALARHGLQVTLAAPNDDPPTTDRLDVQSVTDRSRLNSLVAQRQL